MRLTKVQINYFVQRLDAARADFITTQMQSLGDQPYEAEYSDNDHLEMIRSGAAVFKPDAKLYDCVVEAFTFPLHPDAESAAKKIEAYEQAKRDIKALADKKHQAAMDKLMFMDGGDEVTLLLSTAFA